jgi:hypothetical protein
LGWVGPQRSFSQPVSFFLGLGANRWQEFPLYLLATTRPDFKLAM